MLVPLVCTGTRLTCSKAQSGSPEESTGDQTGDTPEDFPETPGVVRRIWMVSAKPYAGGPNSNPDPDPGVYEQVTESRIIRSRNYPIADETALIWTGVLAEIDVQG
jgi:hypothetical protein